MDWALRVVVHVPVIFPAIRERRKCIDCPVQEG